MTMAVLNVDQVKGWCYLIMAFFGALAALKGAFVGGREIVKLIKAKIETESVKRDALDKLASVAPALLKMVEQFEVFKQNLADNTAKTEQIGLKVDRILNHEHHNAVNVEKIAEEMHKHQKNEG